jgi:hypothetical protein
MSRFFAIVVLIASTGCLKGWVAAQPYACDSSGQCQGALVCDDGVCCAPGSTPSCPTLPFEGACAQGSAATYYPDNDNDGFGSGRGEVRCGMPSRGWSRDPSDCDDRAPTVNPQAQEVCDGLDNNCNGEVDEGLPRRALAGFRDLDQDGFGDTDGGIGGQWCALPAGFVGTGGDCQPDNAKVNPGEFERCNNIDDNCNQLVDEGPFRFETENGVFADQVACNSGQAGVCQAGLLACEGETGDKRPVCTPRVLPSAERCGDRLDNDCDGVVDNPPGCGGPPSLTAAIGKVRPVAVPVSGGLSARSKVNCLDGNGTTAAGWVSPVWMSTLPVFTTSRRNETVSVWSLEAPANAPWDLSNGAQELNLPLTFEAIGIPSNIDPALKLWEPNAFGFQPVVQLCGDNGKLLREYRPNVASSAFSEVSKSVGQPVIALAQSKNGWTQTGTLSIDQVKSLRVLISPQNLGEVNFPLTVLIRFGSEAGFRGGQ